MSEKRWVFNLTVAFAAGVVLLKVVGLIEENNVIQSERAYQFLSSNLEP